MSLFLEKRFTNLFTREYVGKIWIREGDEWPLVQTAYKRRRWKRSGHRRHK